MGLSVEDAKYLGQFKNMDEAYANVQGKFLIDKAGRKAANRDALIPQIGNRRLFAQSRAPWMKFAGSFLSWAQAKTTQTNSLLRRIEDGDGKLALMMLTTLPLYGTVRYLQTQLNPTEAFREEFQSPLETKEDLLKFLADTGIFSAQLMPYWADKIFSSYKYNKNNAVENIYPVFGIVNDAVAGGFDIVTGKPRTGVVKVGETLVPGIKEVTRREELLGIDALGRKEETEDFKAKDTEDEILPRMATGGLVSGPEVPDTKEDPADRVNPFTGSPYSDQMARLGLQDGGEVTDRIIEINNILKELGYSKEARAAKMGNIGVETGYTYDYQQKQKNGDGYGLYQLDFQKPFYNKYLENNKLKDSARNQIMFTHEVLKGNDKIMGMNTKDRQALQEAFKSKDVSFITQMFSEKYEKPGVPHLEKRIEEANRLYQLLEE